MTCPGDKACVFPVLPNGYCANHQWKAEKDVVEILKGEPAGLEPGPVQRVPEPIQEPVKPVSKWKWLTEACHALKVGESFTAQRPSYSGIVGFQNNVSSVLRSYKECRYDKFAIRRAENGNAVVVTKTGVWDDGPKLDELEQERKEVEAKLEDRQQDLKELDHTIDFLKSEIGEAKEQDKQVELYKRPISEAALVVQGELVDLNRLRNRLQDRVKTLAAQLMEVESDLEAINRVIVLLQK